MATRRQYKIRIESIKNTKDQQKIISINTEEPSLTASTSMINDQPSTMMKNPQLISSPSSPNSRKIQEKVNTPKCNSSFTQLFPSRRHAEFYPKVRFLRIKPKAKLFRWQRGILNIFPRRIIKLRTR